ncbi:hypothetical protein SAMN05192558_109238 [Actinokineospora alba]|uniref:YGGT family protein n=1 Tax=Actinokineospora alba TaxID=504798 RepID=A0A1H0T425_9PSEU|nr:hypothetical protein [Actinokineospora alba]TDP66395.1 hypothetical protein C8E96_1902 [Actinokineospora alba]SDJ23980.1 hypothetical protein SAMN05421871_111136 [Actinokineospora alba]SDP48326.1 hypothetical protein SAMN05192558_109238 [Actinokineospora alba]
MADSTEETGREGRTGAQWRADIVGLIANLVRWAGLLIALVLVVHVILVMGNANTANGITTFVRDTADVFVLAFKNLFAPEDAKLGVLINYGLAAIFWLVVTTIVARLIRRLA